MNRFPSVLTVSLLGTSLLFSSCSVKQNLDEMHDATTAVPTKLDETQGTMKEMKKTTEDMKTTTCTMYRSLRQGSSKVSRDQDFQDMQEAKNISSKLAEAAEYMQGFEYQVWTQDCEGELPRDLVIEQFTKELLAKMQGFETNRENVSPSNLLDQLLPARKAKMENLFALSATLHYANSLQANFLAHTSYEVLRPFDILVKGLDIDSKRNRGMLEKAEVPAYADVIGKYSKDAIYLLRLRQNFLMAYAYMLSDSNAVGDLPGTLWKANRLAKSSLFNKPWFPRLENRTASEINERITAALNYSAETHDALVALGIDPMVDSTFIKIWERARFSKFKLPALAKSSNPADQVFGEAVKNLIAARDRMLKTMKSSKN